MHRLAIALGCLLAFAPARAAVPTYQAEVVHIYPHDTSAFTEGLFYLNGYLYESTGLEQHSTIRKVRLETGEVVQKLDIPPQYFGEGIVDWHGRLISLTWKSHVGFVFDLKTLKLQRQFQYPGEGWALTHDDKQLIMSDGTSELRLLDPATFNETGRIKVTVEGKPLRNVNELEWVKGEIYANVWQTNWIVRIDPDSGRVVGAIDLTG
ncbi:MAG TPA: glutaminyl-peptide cyclotransferase, partial [Steroidobacteraceae bacterium]